MKVWMKLAVLLTVAICIMAFCVAIGMRWVVIDAVQQQSLSSKEIIARTLADRIADFVLTGDHYRVNESLVETLGVAPDIEYIYVTSLDGRIFSHTFAGGAPAGILTWNPLRGKPRSIQLLDTEKGFINDIGVSMFGSSRAQIHLGCRDIGLKKNLAAIRNTVFAITMAVIIFGGAASLVVSRAITKPLQNVVDFSKRLAQGEFGATIPHTAKDEMGELVAAFNVLSRQLADNRHRMEEAHQRMCVTEKLNAMSRLSAGLAHELRNPLTAVKVLFNALGSPSEMNDDDMEMIRAELSHMDGILKRFLGVSRSNALDMHEIDLNELLQGGLALLRVPMTRQKITLAFHPGKIPRTVANAPELEQAFLNLFINAIEAMEKGGVMTVQTKKAGNMIETTITDTGLGIPKTIEKQLFDPFVTSKLEGTGLGLFLVKTVVANHHGAILCKSTAKGTTFSVNIPVKRIASSA